MPGEETERRERKGRLTSDDTDQMRGWKSMSTVRIGGHRTRHHGNERRGG